MQDSSIPQKFSIPWGNSAPFGNITNPIPDTPQPQGHASFTEGFGPINSVPVASGGIPPWGSDANGILFMVTLAVRWLQAGGIYPYDGTFSTAIGGYPRGAMVPSATRSGLFWISTIDNNLSNPDAGGANWLQWGSFQYVVVSAPGTSTAIVPDFCNQAWMEGWGGGGGGSGGISGGGAGGAGGAGGYQGGWATVAPGETLTLTNGGGGVGAYYPAAGGNGGEVNVTGSVTGNILQAGGAFGGAAGPGQGGAAGSGPMGGLCIAGGNGTDVSNGTGAYSNGSIEAAAGGSAPRGGQGGSPPNAAGTPVAIWPGGGGGANCAIAPGTAGASGGIFIAFRIGP